MAILAVFLIGVISGSVIDQTVPPVHNVVEKALKQGSTEDDQ